MVHLTRYPTRHVGLLHHSLKSVWFIYSAPYTSLVLSLGFTYHTVELYYLYDSISRKATTTSILLLLHDALIWDGFLLVARRYKELDILLASMPTYLITKAYGMYNGRNDTIHKAVSQELARRKQIK